MIIVREPFGDGVCIVDGDEFEQDAVHGENGSGVRGSVAGSGDEAGKRSAGKRNGECALDLGVCGGGFEAAWRCEFETDALAEEICLEGGAKQSLAEAWKGDTLDTEKLSHLATCHCRVWGGKCKGRGTERKKTVMEDNLFFLEAVQESAILLNGVGRWCFVGAEDGLGFGNDL